VPDAPVSRPAGPDAVALQATLFDFAITELVRQHRDSFPPLWSAESWAKLLIWLALSCGGGADPASLEAFAAALGPTLSSRMRRVFFERELEDLNLRLMADPAEQQVLALPLDARAGQPEPARVAEALSRAGLTDHVAPPPHWQRLESLIALPWNQPEGGQPEETPCA
jgi:hypothetical protein